jgi:pyruvate formate lyase activating enzyme
VTTGLVFDIQHFSVHDGPGIRTAVFLKGCPLRCTWCCNPESQASHPELRHRLARCRRCLACVKACDRGGVALLEGGPGFVREICDTCDDFSCTKACPERALLACGRSMTVAGVIEAAMADEAFFRNSGGGVTFSGGEPFLQHRFLAELLAGLGSAGVRTVVETCGYADPAALQEAVSFLDLILFDLKIADPELHRRYTGRTNALILENLARLSAVAPGKVVLRFPLIPGITDETSNVERIAGIAAGLGITRASVIPYHPMGRAKYEELGRECPVDARPVTRDDLERVFLAFESAGISCELA